MALFQSCSIGWPNNSPKHTLRYVGFFKKIKHTPFGKNDTRYYSPLCLLIGVLTLVVVLNP
ncbi:DUF3995 domain-containing protein [Spirosoma utsteinense]|uniref:DUF3995 domain-containing protein n=1 Tax=Spirosoma utsteinense TaxID=2585773 RepID=UPI001C959651|nr:DUF3995 domain-containing protein [Spirosoma utsteinense]